MIKKFIFEHINYNSLLASGYLEMSLQHIQNLKDYHVVFSSFIHPDTTVIPIEYLIETTNDSVTNFSFKTQGKYSFVNEKSEQHIKIFLHDIVAKKMNRDIVTHQLGFIESIERLYDITDLLSPEHNRLKMILAEFERIQEHLIWFHELLLHSGIPFLSSPILQLKQHISMILSKFFAINGKNLSSCLEVGKINISLPKELVDKLQFELLGMSDKIDQLKEKIINNLKLRFNLGSIGLMDTNLAIKSGTVGPLARASAVEQDLRIDDPYFDYLTLGEFKLAQSFDQDIYGLVKVLLTEISVSFELINTIIAQDFSIKPENLLDEIDMKQSGQMVARLESSKGPVLYSLECKQDMVVTGYGISTPGLANLYSLETRLKGVPIGHVTKIIHAYNITDLAFMKS